MKIITRLEEAVLIAIWRLKEDAYGVTINKEVSKTSKKSYSMGALYFSLDQLLRKGYVNKRLVNLHHEKGGRSRTYYQLTLEGRVALQQAKDYQNSLWEGLSEISLLKEE
jgi:DNA-binding PadR family transcriptional regulator